MIQFYINYFETYEYNISNPNWVYLDKIDEIASIQAKERLLNLDDPNGNIEFLELFVRKCNGIEIDIVNYNDFIQSDYYLIIKIIDHRNIEIYCKYQNILDRILQNINYYSSKVKFESIKQLKYR